MIDITGNWHEGQVFCPHISVCERDLAAGQRQVFRQSLTLPRGKHRIELEYDEHLDRHPGQALDGCLENFSGLRINGKVTSIRFIGSRGLADVLVDANPSIVKLE